MGDELGDELVLRTAEDADVPAMAAIRAAESQSQALWEYRIGGYLQGTYSPQQALPERSCWVAVQGGELAGFVAGHRTVRFACDGELQWINVAQEFRGQGISTRLTDVMLSWFRQKNMNRICVNVGVDNTVARHLYARHGAVAMNDGWMEWRDLRQSAL